MPFILGANSAADTVHSVSQSIRFNSADDAYMARTPSSAGNRRTWTFSCWLKRGNITSTMQLFNAGADDSNNSRFQINSDDVISYVHADSGSVTDQVKTSMKIRDTAAWYNIQLVADTTHPVDEERLRIFVNGRRITDLSITDYPTKDFDTDINNTEAHNIGRLFSDTQHLDGYLAEIVLVDGQALYPSSFGEFNSSGLWIPKNVSGLTFGTNGFYINGSDASGTPVKLGDDEAGSNNYTTYNMEANDQRADTPTNNQITFNFLNNQRSGGTLSEGNLRYVGPGTRTLIGLTANVPSTGKWAVAYTVDQVSTTAGWQIGLSFADDDDFGDAAGSNEDLDIVRIQPSSSNAEVNDRINNSYISPSPAVPLSTSDEFWVVVDMNTGNIFLGIYDASDTTMKFIAADGGTDGDPANGTNPTLTATTTQMPRDNVLFSVCSKQTSQFINLKKSSELSGTTPTGFTYFENVKDLIGS